MAVASREVHLIERPEGLPVATQFQIVETTIDDPAEGEFLIRNQYMSVDPAMRPRLSNGQQPLHKPLGAGTIGVVTASRHSAFAEGDVVQHGLGFREYVVSDGRGVSRLDAAGFPPTLYMHVLGPTGFTAWGGMLITGELKDGENVFVSAAAGAVGSVAAQIARIKGCYVIGSAGSSEKCKNLKAAATQGIDVYFENVGGEHLDAALPRMNVGGRIPVCGMISAYNNFGARSTGVTTLSNMVYQRITMRGFVVTDFEEKREKFLDDMRGWVADGQMKYRETVFEGIEQAADALIGLFTGENIGKALVKLD